MGQTLEPGDLWTWVVMQAAPGADLVELVRQLDTPGAHTAWVEGFGQLKNPVVLTQSDAGGRFERRLTGTWDLITLRGSPKGDLLALLARDSTLGPQQIGGLLASGEIVSSTVRIGSIAASLSDIAPSATVPAGPPPPTPPAAPTPPSPAAAPAAAPSSPGVTVSASASASTPMPKRPITRDDGPEQYPEEGDSVTHFAFGRCTVLFSDGERLRLQQERDGRVREVALSMLKVQDPTASEDGHRHWDLLRKN